MMTVNIVVCKDVLQKGEYSTIQYLSAQRPQWTH